MLSESSIRRTRLGVLIALAISVIFHGSVLLNWPDDAAEKPSRDEPVRLRVVSKPAAETSALEPSSKPKQAPVPSRQPKPASKDHQPAKERLVVPQGVKSPASMAAPAAPSAEEWQLAASYTPRNSKRYRHAWGQQVRSMMGTAVEGPSQGHVRFRISIAPDGTISEIKELWSTSEEASRLAWKAIQEMPRLPPTPTGQPLVFEQTISFVPYDSGWPPSYQLDCLPEIEPFKNPFAWDGSAQPTVVRRTHRPPPPEGCPPDSTAATIEEEEHEMKRQTAQWRWGR